MNVRLSMRKLVRGLAMACALAPVLAALPEPIANWRIELVAEAPVLRHPSVVACAPDGRVFVAEDPMDITAPADAKLGRILCLQPNGRTTVFATNLHAVFGLQYLEGKLFALHNPKFTVFTDAGDHGADRIDLVEQTNPNPWALDWNDHIPANFRLGMDGYFYVAVGDKGLYECVGRDGSKVNLPGGGILRMRPDATELEVFSTGVRNILDVAIDAEDSLFTYDNTDEHQWMGRLTHMVDGGFYGYPHDFIPQRPYTLWMMHDFGAGAACGAFAYNEDALPDEYRQSLFLSDFGKRQVFRVQIERSAGTYRVVQHEDLFRTVPDDFRPVGIGLSPDGTSIYICDWQHRDTKSDNANVGRLWKLAWTGPVSSRAKPSWWVPVAQGKPSRVSVEELIAGLHHPSHSVRMTAQRALSHRGASAVPSLRGALNDPASSSSARTHALWALDAVDGGESARPDALRALESPDPSLARQAIRLAGTRKYREAVPPLVATLSNPDASLAFESATALGRLGATNAIPRLQAALTTPSLFPHYAAFHALHRIGLQHPSAWAIMVSGLASPDERVRNGTWAAFRDTYSVDLVEALSGWFRNARVDLAFRATALELLGRLAHQPPEWKGEWWAYHPAKAPAPERTRPWAGTAAILALLRAALEDSSPTISQLAIQALGQARDAESAPALRRMLETEGGTPLRVASASALARMADPQFDPLAVHLFRAAATPPELRLALAHSARPSSSEALVAALSETLRQPGSALPLRLAAVEALGRIGRPAAVDALRVSLTSATVDERRAAVRALGQLRARSAVPELLAAWSSPESRDDAFAALCRISDLRALEVYLDGLASPDATRREEARKACEPLRRELLPLLANRATPLPPLALSELKRLYADDPESLHHPVLAAAAEHPDAAGYERYALAQRGDPKLGRVVFENLQTAACSRCHVVAGQGGHVGPDLTLAGSQFSRAQLIESVLYPSRAVREGYQQIIVETRDDESIAGALKADTGDGLTLVDASGRTNFVPRASIADRRTSALSLMPEGIQAGLTLEEFAGLIAYLESLRAAAPRAP